ncbi:hypothetical protein Dimus_032206 [Dionaea muscipula]
MMTRFNKTPSFLIFFIWAALGVFSFRSSISDSISIYDALKSHGLPMGLLPKGVTNYTWDHENGMFEVFLDQACNAKFESELHYDRNVSGQLGLGQIGNLSGISAQELFLWFPVKGIRVDIPSSGVIYFDVGVVFKQFSLSLFETPPDCMAAAHPPSDFDDGTLISDM